MSAAFETNFDGLTALRFGRYDVAYATENDAIAGPSVRGLAAVHLGRIAEARKIAAQVPAADFTQGYLAPLFKAELAQAAGNYDEAERWLDRSLANQRATFAAEMIPPIPTGEALGALRLKRGDIAGAIAAFRDTLEAYPNDPRALFGLAQALTVTGESAQAAATRSHFEKEWEGADSNVQDAFP